MLATKFGSYTKLDRGIPLNNDQLFKIAPSIFAGEKHESRSERYTYIPTIQVVDGLRSEGVPTILSLPVQISYRREI